MFERKKSAGKIYFLPIDQIHPSPFQARQTFEEQELAGLAQSIRENGLLQPISVRKAAEGYELVAGEAARLQAGPDDHHSGHSVQLCR
jgi:ParB family chromosome partitioning protein